MFTFLHQFCEIVTTPLDNANNAQAVLMRKWFNLIDFSTLLLFLLNVSMIPFLVIFPYFSHNIRAFLLLLFICGGPILTIAFNMEFKENTSSKFFFWFTKKKQTVLQSLQKEDVISISDTQIKALMDDFEKIKKYLTLLSQDESYLEEKRLHFVNEIQVLEFYETLIQECYVMQHYFSVAKHFMSFYLSHFLSFEPDIHSFIQKKDYLSYISVEGEEQKAIGAISFKSHL